MTDSDDRESDNRDGDRERADPFDSLDADEYRDREGDPFANLGDEDSRDADAREPSPETGGESAPEADGTPSPEPVGGDPTAEGPGGPGDPFEHMDGSDIDGSGGDPSGTSPDQMGDPTAGLGAEVAQQGGDDDPFDANSTFESVDVEEIDPDDIWQGLTDARQEGSVSDPPPEDDRAEVSKHRYCEQCEYFSPPPSVHCEHEGTEILEFTDMEHVEVSNCPVVADRRELGETE
jgi:hypothetical protein